MSVKKQAGFVELVKVIQGQKTVSIDQVRQVREDQYTKVIGPQKAEKGVRIVRLTDEQFDRLQSEQQLSVAELGIFDDAVGVKVVAENDLLKKEVAEKDKALEAALAELHAIKSAKEEPAPKSAAKSASK